MELINEFEVAVPIEQAWAVLTDVERIAPCMPGAQLQEVEGDEYRGVVKVKVGPITAQYKGTAHFIEQDEANHNAVLRAEGRDTRGQGNANATVTATLEGVGDKTAVSVVTELTVTGKVAQFGRGVMADVSAKLLDQFVACLHEKVLAGNGATPEATSEATPEAGIPTQTVDAVRVDAEPAASTASTDGGPRRIEGPEAEPVDLVDAAGGPVAKRMVPLLAFLGVVGLLLARRVRRRRRRRSQ